MRAVERKNYAIKSLMDAQIEKRETERKTPERERSNAMKDRRDYIEGLEKDTVSSNAAENGPRIVIKSDNNKQNNI